MAGILIIDDDPSFREILREFVEAKSHTVYEAGDADEGLRVFLTEKIDLVVSDLVMPERDGLELLREMRIVRPDVLFIMITGYPTVESNVQAMKEGAYDYLIKPLDMDQLTGVLNRALGTLEMKRSMATMKGMNLALLISIPIWLIVGAILALILR
jgi:DNA-binding NtrC family response regulator